MIADWGPRAYEILLAKKHSPNPIFKGLFYFGGGSGGGPEFLEHVGCTADFGGSHKGLQFLLEHLG